LNIAASTLRFLQRPGTFGNLLTAWLRLNTG
jgi:hypothetical protein